MDIINKIIGLILSFVLMCLAPIVIDTMLEELKTTRTSMNEMTNFIDKVTDSGIINDVDKADFQLAMATHGVVFDINIKRYVRVVSPDGDGGTKTTYSLSEKTNSLNTGDVVNVEAKAIAKTSGQKIYLMILGINDGEIDIEFAGRVRK